MTPNIGLFDIFLGAFYLLIIYFLVFRFQAKIKLPNISFSYFIGALSIKIIAAITFVLLSLFYYKSGDTFLYFEIAEELRQHLFINTSETLSLIFTPYSGLEKLNYHPLQVYNYQFERSTTWAFSRIVFFFNLASFGSYLVSSILMSLISFLGLWMGYNSLSKLYPSSEKLLLIPFFGIPTALIWSSGILKDTLLIGIIGFLISIGINLFIKKRKIILNSLYLALCSLLLIGLKPILVLSLIPCFIFWGVLHYSSGITNFTNRILVRFTFLLLTLSCIFLISNNLSETSKYKFDKLTLTLITYQLDHSNNKVSNTNYNLGTIEYENFSIAKKIPKAINVTFFRPYLWEVINLPMLLSSIESLLLLLVLFFVIFSLRKRLFKIIFTNEELIFFFSFAILYSIISGLTAYNFGALSRFKIPSIMFFLIALVLLTNNSMKNNKSTSAD